jgi:hypothetical protein
MQQPLPQGEGSEDVPVKNLGWLRKNIPTTTATTAPVNTNNSPTNYQPPASPSPSPTKKRGRPPKQAKPVQHPEPPVATAAPSVQTSLPITLPPPKLNQQVNNVNYPYLNSVGNSAVNNKSGKLRLLLILQ